MNEEQLATIIAKGIRTAMKPFAERITALEARGCGVEYAGTFEQGRTYRKGSLCTKGGGLWLALDTTTMAPGTDPASWKLVVKSGEGR